MGLGLPELLIILVIVFLVFGAGKLPEVMSQLGKGVKSFKEGAAEAAVAKRPVAKTSQAKPAPKATATKKAVAAKKPVAKAKTKPKKRR